MNSKIEYYEFRKDLYFYHLVSSFSISLCGCPVIFDKKISSSLPQNQSLSFSGTFTGNKQMSPYALKMMAEKGYIDKSNHITTCCMMLANTAYESVKHFKDGSEIFEFFRHIRNASSHLNIFLFNHKEPSNPAKWRGAQINEQLKGEDNPFYQQPCFGQFLGVADLLDLLMDIEKIIIKKIEKTNEIPV